jgi:VWFA-related protein
MKTDRCARLLAFAITLAAASLSGFAQDAAQQPSQPSSQPSDRPVLHQRPQEPAPSTIAVKVQEVHLLAIVRDKKGQAVNTLDKKDFALEQDGRAQTITQFAHESDVPLTLGVLADTGPGQRKTLADERKAGTEFVNHLLREDKDKAFVLHFDKEVELLQDVTASHDKLARGIDAISVGEQHGSGRKRDQDDSGQPHYFFGGSMLYDAIFLSSDEVLKTLKGRKAVVVFSDGVDRGSKTGLTGAIESAQKADTLVYCVYVPSEREQEQGGYGDGNGGGRRGGGYPGGGGGPFPGGGYPGGGGGGRGRRPEPPRENRTDGKKILQQIARETGGRYFELSKKLTAADIYKQIDEELRHQYSLSYTPDKAEFGYHKLHLSTHNGDWTVQTREGFYSE